MIQALLKPKHGQGQGVLHVCTAPPDDVRRLVLGADSPLLKEQVHQERRALRAGRFYLGKVLEDNVLFQRCPGVEGL